MINRKRLSFVFNTWTEEFTNEEFMMPLGRRLKQINQEIEIDAQNNVFTITFESKYENELLSELEAYSGTSLFDRFKNTITIQELS